METNTNLKYADSSPKYYVIIIVQKLYKKNSHSRGMKCHPKANNDREAVVVCARPVVMRPSQRMRASTLLKRD